MIRGIAICDRIGCGKFKVFNAGDKILPCCSKCRYNHYCGKECQTTDWEVHKAECDTKRACRYRVIVELLQKEVPLYPIAHDYILLECQEELKVQISGLKANMLGGTLPEAVKKLVTPDDIIFSVRGLWVLIPKTFSVEKDTIMKYITDVKIPTDVKDVENFVTLMCNVLKNIYKWKFSINCSYPEIEGVLTSKWSELKIIHPEASSLRNTILFKCIPIEIHPNESCRVVPGEPFYELAVRILPL